MPPPLAALALPALLAGLLLTPPAAATELRFSGDARMGILRSADLNEDSPRWSFTQRLRVTVEAEGTTDGGLTFGGRLRLDRAVPQLAPLLPERD